MKKLTTLLLAVLFTGKLLFAQTVDEARKSLNNGRIASAREALQKLAAANNKNTEAIYWLGQAYLAADDIANAKKTYQDGLGNNPNDPWLVVGMGHIALLEGNKADAKQRFEVAISSSMNKKKENPAVLNAIGRANADGGSAIGDPAYGVEKLKRAAELDPNNPDIYINLGINYIKQNDGTNAYDAYTSALRIDPNSARANYRLGKIFQSQNNREKFLEYYDKAIAADPSFGPAYLELYDYYSNRDVNKAGDYLQKYVANSDKDCNTEFLYADYLFRSGKYSESLAKAKAMESGPCSSYPRLKVLYAYNYDRLGDAAQARTNIESYMSTAAPDKIQAADYIAAANIVGKTSGGEQSAINYLMNALKYDTVSANRKIYLDSIASKYKMLGNATERLKWLRQSYSLNTNPTNLDIYNLADAAIAGGNFALSDTMSRLYIQKYPNQQEYGYKLLARGAKAQDKDTTTGSAIAVVMEYIHWMEQTDKVKYKNTIIDNYGYLVGIHANVQKDYSAALKDIDGILAIDPTNTYAQNIGEQIKKAMNSKGGGTPKKQSAPVKKGK